MLNRFRCTAMAVLIAFLLAATGCHGSTKPAATTAPPEVPQVTPAANKQPAPTAQRYVGYSLRLKPVRGPEMIVKEPVAAQLIMDNFSSDRLQVKDAVGDFGNKLDVLDPDGKAQYSFTLSSDGQMLLKAKDGLVFRMPEYVYYLLEQSLWNYSGSLKTDNLKWDTTKGTAQLELELPRLIKSAMLPAFGYSSAYFCSYKIYGVDTSTRDTAKVFILLDYAGYDVKEAAFSPNFSYISAVTLIFSKVSNGVWQLTDLKQPPIPKESKELYTCVRSIFPYDYMDDVMDDLKGVSKQKSSMAKDIVRQATEYLNAVGINGLTVDN